MDKCKNTFIGTGGKVRKTLPVLAAVAIAGCGGGSSGGDGGDDPTNASSLSDSQKAVAVAFSIAGQANSLSDQAVNQASGAADTSGPVESQSVSAATTQNPFDDCAAIDSSVAPGFVTQEGDIRDISTITFPEPFTQSANDSLGQKEDAFGRANCTIEQLNALGAYDIVQREAIDGNADRRLVFAEAGGLGDASLNFATRPDVSTSMVLETSATSLSIPTLRYRMHICNGCVDGDLSNWTGDPQEHITSVAFIELETVISGNRSYARMGTPADPFVLQAAPDSGGTNNIQVEVDGEYQVTNGALEGCTLGATVSTETNGPLLVDSLTEANATPTGGAVDITPAGSGETFTVTFPPGGGEPLVNGQPVSNQDLTAVSNCGFVSESST